MNEPRATLNPCWSISPALARSQPPAQERDRFGPHGGCLKVAGLVAKELPGVWRLCSAIDTSQFTINPIQSRGRCQWIVIPRQAQVRARRDEGVDLRGAKVFQQARHVIVDAVPVQPA